MVEFTVIDSIRNLERINQPSAKKYVILTKLNLSFLFTSGLIYWNRNNKLAINVDREKFEAFLSKMKDIEAKNGYFTARDLSIALRRKVGYIRNVLNKYNRNGVVNKIEGVKSDGIRFYPAKFMIKNEQLY